uniref:Uncharacterized protein n=1 Tax=Rhizophora mucronata TaxID=61149 RepID=A0A2P2P4D9_RHIMU
MKQGKPFYTEQAVDLHILSIWDSYLTCLEYKLAPQEPTKCVVQSSLYAWEKASKVQISQSYTP